MMTWWTLLSWRLCAFARGDLFACRMMRLNPRSISASVTVAQVVTIKRRDKMYMMEKLDAYKQEIERTTTWKDWYQQQHWMLDKNVPEYHKELMLRYANEMLRVHDDIKKYCNALLIKAQAHSTAVDRATYEYRKLNEDYEKLKKQYMALKKATAAKKLLKNLRSKKPQIKEPDYGNKH
jgi:hypothetical protein